MGRWDDHVVWLTGGGTGLGRYMALELARGGAKVAVSGRRKEPLDEVVAAIGALGGEAVALTCDVTREEDQERVVAAVVERWGKLDVAVANAGFSVAGPVEKLTADEWRRQFDINVVGSAVTAAKAIPHLRDTKGRLALVGSVAAMVHFPKAGPYQASKAAIIALGNTLSAELMPDGISCTTIHPGFVKSDIYKVDNAGNVHEDRKDRRPANLMWETDDAAAVMVDAIWRRKREFVFTGHGRIGWFLGRHFPGLVHLAARRIAAPTKE